MYLPRHFKPEELLDRATFERFGADGLRYYRTGILRALDWVWETYPTRSKRSIQVNTWLWGGPQQWRGLRLPGSPAHKPHSAHSWGAAIDFVAEGIAPAGMRAWIQAEHARAMATLASWMPEGGTALRNGTRPPVLCIRRMEKDTASWVHIDSLEHAATGIWMVNP